jgi:hypothetical protein
VIGSGRFLGAREPWPPWVLDNVQPIGCMFAR